MTGIFVALLLAGGISWFFPQQVLTVDSGAIKSDVTVVLGGQPQDRAGRAAELYKAGAAPKILLSGFGDDLEEERILVAKGVPPRP